MTGHAGNGRRDFGKRKEPHRVIIARGDNVRSFTISPLVAGLATAVGTMLMVGYVGATAYLVLRDDIIQSSAERQAQMQLSYEDRIASLRSRIDQLTSRRVLERRSIEEQLADVVERQRDLDTRQARVSGILAKAAENGIRVAVGGPVPPAKPAAPAVALGSLDAPTGIGGTPEPIEISPVLSLRGTKADYNAAAEAAARQGAAAPGKPLRDLAPEAAASQPQAPANPPAPDQRVELIDNVNAALDRMDGEAHAALDVIAVTAERDAATIADTADELGLQLAGVKADLASGQGGPFVPLAGSDFDSRIERAEKALLALSQVKDAARGIPLASPVPGAELSSSFGPRVDPFLGRMAMHTGLDFRATTGVTIRAPAPGKVIFAGRNGGYGRSVEIRHPSGVVTRFAHMSRVSVSEGDTVSTGDPLGAVGSTGRSTGPHLHYEVRVNDRPLNPIRFLRAGEKIATLLDD
ncbi:peptidoglycan DD-metalloendopeptidase family protein [Stappia indica]|uniref:peptidoglycan DD-metalloendopeptidase family protein n=1 Tax=Stappia indica TaxID=538381 RepID=UPI000BE43755|nr:peptidoglycan DD-metalloendopeptidase family protein [Stappia indica]MCC4246895.1 M23 family metallopeptidase [Stappia indica]